MSDEKYLETIKCKDGEVYNLAYHQKRVKRTIGKDLLQKEHINPPSKEFLKCRLIYTKDEILDITYDNYTIKKPKSFKLVFDDNIIYDKKSLQRESINALYKTKDKADEVIIVKNSLVTDTSIANIAIFYNNKWLTPQKPLLYGTTLDRYLSSWDLYQADITVDMLRASNKIALMNAMVDFLVVEDGFRIELC